MFDKEYLGLLFQIIIFLPFILFLIYLFAKLSGGKIDSYHKKRFIKVMERTQLSKENTLLVVKIGDKPYVISSTNGKVEILKELEEHEVKHLENINMNIPTIGSLKHIYKKHKSKEED